ncbi:MAG: hypothetical protein H0A76_09960 [Candidatus Thiodubiliella endoseptemdiera]|uniref:Uncharacterized protein n=1 Tax=Candidatus Thiodubiliella endoseptemdiera TaxID=2738886 RepID=A0A853F585_9GAMM|nr:hypothetical protein [Candidatus Thiodubiliella endoseptemdiera]
MMLFILTGTLMNTPNKTVVDSTYTFERTANINGKIGYQEEVSFYSL